MRIALLLGFIWFPGILLCQQGIIQGNNQKFIHATESNALFVIETIEPGTTLYSISRKYHVPIEHLLQANQDLNPESIPLGYPVNIPIHPKSISYTPPAESENFVWLAYRVQPKETLYRISRVYLQINTEQITDLNPTVVSGLRSGQILHVGWLNLSSNDSSILWEAIMVDSTMSLPKDYIKEAGSEGKVIHVQKGLAIWKPGKVSSNYYVLHPTAKLGSFMEITNPMLHRTITAKVAGHIPPGLYQSHVGIVVSPSTAMALGVLDQHFFARWRYVE